MGALDFLVLGSAVETFTAGFDRPASAYAAEQPQLADALSAVALATVDDEAFDVALEAWLDIVAMSRTAPDAS